VPASGGAGRAGRPRLGRRWHDLARVEHLEHPLPAGRPPGQGPGEPGQGPDGPVQAGQVREHDQQRPQGHPPTGHRRHPQPQHQPASRGQQQVGHRRPPRLQVHRPKCRSHRATTAPREVPAGLVLAGEGLHHPDVAQHLGRLAGQRRVRVPGHPLGGPDPPPPHRHHQRQRRHHSQRRQPQRQVDRQHDHDHPGQRQHLGNKHREPGHHRVLDPSHVPRQPGHQVPRPMAVMERQPQPEHPPEHRLPQVGAHPLGRRRRQIGDQVSDQRPHPDQPEPRRDGHRRQPTRTKLIEHRQPPTQRLPSDRVVHRQLQRPRPRQIDQGLHQDQPRGERQAPPVWVQKPPKGPGAGGSRGWGVGHPSLPRRALARNPAATMPASRSAPPTTPATTAAAGPVDNRGDPACRSATLPTGGASSGAADAAGAGAASAEAEAAPGTPSGPAAGRGDELRPEDGGRRTAAASSPGRPRPWSSPASTPGPLAPSWPDPDPPEP
jgi:hypothetical protein